MAKVIENPANCEIRSMIRFLNAKNVKPVDIHQQLSEVYGQNVMSYSMVVRWVKQFNNGRVNLHDERRSGRPSLVNDEMNEKNRGNRLRFLFFLWNFPKFHDPFFMKLFVTNWDIESFVHAGYRKPRITRKNAYLLLLNF